MFESVAAFRAAYEHESAATRRLLETLTDESLACAVAPGYRTLGRIAWHLTLSIPDFGRRLGLRFDAPDEDAPVPAAREIAARYSDLASSLLAQVSATWDDATLRREDDLFGERWPRGYSLLVLLLHEAHHRGQMTVLMRQAGLELPGVAGPAKQEWAQWGMAPPAV